MFRRAMPRGLGPTACPSRLATRSRLRAAERARPEPDTVGAFSTLSRNQATTATRSGEVQSPSMYDSANTMSPERTHFLKNASRWTRMRAEPATPRGSGSGPAPNSAVAPSGRATCSLPRAIAENAARTGARKAEGRADRESTAEAEKNPGSEFIGWSRGRRGRDRLVGAVQGALVARARRLGEPRDALKAQPEGVEVDEQDHLDGNEGVLERVPCQPGRREGPPAARERAGKRPLRPGVVVYAYREAVVGSAQPEVERHVDIRERGDVEELRDPGIERGRAPAAREGAGPQEVRLHLAERVRHLGDRGRPPARRVVAEIERDRVEQVSRHAGKRQQQDAAARYLHAAGPKVGDHALLQAPARRGAPAAVVERLAGRQVVALPEAVEVAPVHGQEGDRARQAAQLVQVDAKKEDVVGKPVGLRRKPVVHHLAFVKAGPHGLGHSFCCGWHCQAAHGSRPRSSSLSPAAERS